MINNIAKRAYQWVTRGALDAGSAAQKSLRDSTAAAPPELRRRARQLLLGALVIFVTVAGLKYFFFLREKWQRDAEEAAGPRVRVATIKKGQGEHSVKVIGETRPYQSATLYAKVSGYLKKVAVDKGDVVKEGQVLAVIESPETDQAFVAAQADARNKQAILVRMRNLYAKQLVSQQEYDQAKADSDVANAKLKSEQVLKGYETLRAPFIGTVTARYADPGALVQNAMTSETSALPVVMVSEIKRLRVDVFLDQRDAPFVQAGDPVTITLAERPGFKIEGRVSRLTGELDPRTKMLLTEIDIPNEDRALVAGSFVEVSIQVKAPSYLEAPVESLVLQDNKSYLTVVTSDGHLTYRAVEIGSNDGKVLSILTGAQENETVALNVGNSIPEGSKVRPIAEGAKK